MNEGWYNSIEYIENEVKLRVHDEKFRILENKMNWTIALIVGSWIVPIILKFLE
jgi:hypothetical protein